MAASKSLTPEQRALRARLAAHESWARTDDRAARTAPARQAMADRFVREAREKFGDLPDDELQRRAHHLRQAHFLRLSMAAARARQARAARKSRTTRGGRDA